MVMCGCGLQLLEDALRTHPSSVEERWEKISAAVGTRTKVECVNRVKVRSKGAGCFRSRDYLCH